MTWRAQAAIPLSYQEWHLECDAISAKELLQMPMQKRISKSGHPFASTPRNETLLD